MQNLNIILSTISSSPIQVMLWILSLFSLAFTLVKTFPLRLRHGRAEIKEERSSKLFFSSPIMFNGINLVIGVACVFIGLLLLIVSSFVIVNGIELPDIPQHVPYLTTMLGLVVVLTGYGVTRNHLIAKEMLSGGMLAMISSMVFWWPDKILSSTEGYLIAFLQFAIGQLLIWVFSGVIQLMRHPRIANRFQKD